VYSRKNICMDLDRQSSAVEVGRASRNPAGRRSDFAHLSFWKAQGLSVRAATAVAAADCQSVDEIRDLGWLFFRRQENCGNRTLEELSDLVGGWPDAPRKRGPWIRRASDDLLIKELRRRGIPAGRGGLS
jgi:hypothetical protein